MFTKKIKHTLSKLRNRILPTGFDGWLRIYPTLECNLRCPYCVHLHNQNESVVAAYRLVSWEQWADFINKAQRHLIITGGEPFLYPDLVRLINAIEPQLKVKVYTNFSLAVDEFVAKCRRPVTFFASYHPVSGAVESFLQRIEKVQAHGKFPGAIHMVGWERQLDFLKKVKEKFARRNWFVYIDEDQYHLSAAARMEFRKKVRCTRRIFLVAPDGNRYHCVSHMLRRVYSLGNVFRQELGPEKITLTCPDYGYCNPCDSLGETKIELL